ncbi:alpha/beta hydrolase fold domain-containing protein [Siccirubricoccus deserti]
MADARLDPEMAAFNAMMEARAAAMPPITLTFPFDGPRALNDQLSMSVAGGGPALAVSEDRWLPVRGRRIQCRVHLPPGPGPHPVLVYIHGGGWVWGSIDTHDRLMREYAAAAGCAVIGPDYALSPEAVFPQALEECAGVLRWVAAHGAEWGSIPAASCSAATAPEAISRPGWRCTCGSRADRWRCAACCSTTASSTAGSTPRATGNSPPAMG